ILHQVAFPSQLLHFTFQSRDLPSCAGKFLFDGLFFLSRGFDEFDGANNPDFQFFKFLERSRHPISSVALQRAFQASRESADRTLQPRHRSGCDPATGRSAKSTGCISIRGTALFPACRKRRYGPVLQFAPKRSFPVPQSIPHPVPTEEKDRGESTDAAAA